MVSTHVKKSLGIILALLLHLTGGSATIGSPDEDGSGWGKELAKYEEKEYVRDESLPIVEPELHTNRDRRVKTCGQNQRLLILRLRTDRYGYETKFQILSMNGVFAKGPPYNGNFADLTTYTYKYCVRVGQQYRLKLMDSKGDGFCCGFGKGTISLQIGNQVIYNTRGRKTFRSVGAFTFRVKARPFSNPNPAPAPAPAPAPVSKIGGANPSTGCITVRVKADRRPAEVSWRILNANGARVATSPAMKALQPVSKRVCLPRGKYRFVMQDNYGDGICCGQGQGQFFVYVNGREIIRGGNFASQKSYNIQIAPNYHSRMMAREREWLVTHNTRRRKYHVQFGKSYVPLQWSPGLAAQAKVWANKLLAGCGRSGIEHEQGILPGENLAKNRGTGSYAKRYPADNILTRWVERERNVGYPANFHLTQCLWRSTKYVGCGESTRQYSGGTCHIQVCRYARAGNCAMGPYKPAIGNNWIKPMMEDHTRCGPDCPPEGCY